MNVSPASPPSDLGWENSRFCCLSSPDGDNIYPVDQRVQPLPHGVSSWARVVLTLAEAGALETHASRGSLCFPTNPVDRKSRLSLAEESREREHMQGLELNGGLEPPRWSLTLPNSPTHGTRPVASWKSSELWRGDDL